MNTLIKLGRLPVRHDARTLKLAKYLPQLPTPPPVCDWGAKVSVWGMCCNDRLGCCTVSAIDHMLTGWIKNDTGVEFAVTDAQTVLAYSAITGYNPKTGANDNGAVELDVLNYWRNKGIAGKKILAYVKLAENNADHLKISCFLFGGVYIGVSLPLSAQGQKLWDVVDDPIRSQPGSWGGHAIPIVGYNDVGPVCVTWGELQPMTWAFFFKYCDEAYAIISRDWTGTDDMAPCGFDFAQLAVDLAELNGQASVESPSLWNRFKQWCKGVWG